MGGPGSQTVGGTPEWRVASDRRGLRYNTATEGTCNYISMRDTASSEMLGGERGSLCTS